MKKLLAVLSLAALFAAPQAGRAEDITRFAPLKAEELSPPQKAWAEMIAHRRATRNSSIRPTAPISAAPIWRRS